ncbi:MAG: XdhC/CoxI family protein [Candidatus Eremiobacterota bacterium]
MPGLPGLPPRIGPPGPPPPRSPPRAERLRYSEHAPQEHRLYLDLADRLARSRPTVVATIVRAWGSTPREVGAKMLIDPDGSIAGTVGGGCGEAEVWQQAQQVLEDSIPRLVHVDLTEPVDSDDGKVCGGRFDVFVDLWRPDLAGLAQSLARGLEARADLAVVTVLGSTRSPEFRKERSDSGPLPQEVARAGARLLVERGRLSGTLGLAALDLALEQQLDSTGVKSLPVGSGSLDVFVELLSAPPELVIAGAGHIARPLTRMAALCGYEVTVVDDRPIFADRRWFPEARQVLCAPFAETFRGLEVTDRTHVVLVTRGHKHDEEILRTLIGRPAAYVGMIGSRRRTAAVLDDLRRDGVDPDWLGRLHAPIGLDIGAETPEEIAVAILAELIKVRRGGKAASLVAAQRRIMKPP